MGETIEELQGYTLISFCLFLMMLLLAYYERNYFVIIAVGVFGIYFGTWFNHYMHTINDNRKKGLVYGY